MLRAPIVPSFWKVLPLPRLAVEFRAIAICPLVEPQTDLALEVAISLLGYVKNHAAIDRQHLAGLGRVLLVQISNLLPKTPITPNSDDSEGSRTEFHSELD